MAKAQSECDMGAVAAIVENPNTPDTALKIFVNHHWWYVRACIAKHPNTPLSALELLAVDHHKDVRQAVREVISNNPDIPAYIHNILDSHY